MQKIPVWFRAFAPIAALCSGLWIMQVLQKPLWFDEHLTIDVAVDCSWTTLLSRGAPGQASPSPLYYIVIKPLRACHGWLSQQGFKPEVFYRLPSLIAILAAIICFLMVAPHRYSFWICIVGAVLFVLSHKTYAYAAEARPYAFWLAVSVGLLAGQIEGFSGRRAWVLVVLSAFTATAVLFQFVGLGVGFLLAHAFLSKPITTPRRLVELLGVGVALSSYYILYSARFDFFDARWGTWNDFMSFAMGYKWVMAATLLLSAHFYQERDVAGLRTAFAVIVWFAISPAIYFLTRWRGNFFADRQYIYWSVVAVWVCLELLRFIRYTWAEKWSGRLLLKISISGLLLYKTAFRLSPDICIKDAVSHFCGAAHVSNTIAP